MVMMINRMTKYWIIAVLSVISLVQVSAQTKQAYINAAEQAFEEKNYYAALRYYEEVLEFKKPDAYVYFKAAESARHFFSFEKAFDYYKAADERKEGAELPLAPFYAGEMAYKTGEYDAALKYYRKYLTEQRDSENFYVQTATNRIESIEWAEAHEESVFETTVEKTGGPVNTGQSEFAPVKLGDDLVFSALRYPGGDPTQKPLGMILNNKQDTVFQFVAKGDSNYYQAHFALTPDENRVYYTMCEYVTGEVTRCDLFYSSRVEGEWSDPMPVSELNDDSYSNTTPAYGTGPDGKSEGLYFSSDRPGGRGGYDLYFSAFSGENFEEPTNIYALNTPLDELAPFYHKTTNALFFSSDGYSGYGGLDIFQVVLPIKADSRVENLGTPLNSSYDDAYFFWDEEMTRAYFASNREESYKLDTVLNACCFDIYEADLKMRKQIVKVQMFNKLNGEPLLGTDLEVRRMDEVIITESNDVSHEYDVDLQRGNYLLKGNKAGFLSDSTDLTANEFAIQDTIIKRLYLTPKELILELLTFDAETGEPVNGPTISVADVNDPNKENIYQLNNLTNSLVLPIERDFEYSINVQKRGYEQEDLIVNGADHPDELRIVKKIYLKRGNLESYLVLPLYFDNDFPDPRTWRTTSTKAYIETFPPYFSKKHEFKELYAEPLVGESKEVAQTDVENFFDNEVLAGKQDLERFLQQLKKEMEKGEKVTLVVSGFASPKYLKNYNINLSQRRIHSLRKELSEYDNGSLASYLRNKTLDIQGKAYGDETAPETVSDSPEDTRLSVYSPEASRERRVEIVDIIRN